MLGSSRGTGRIAVVYLALTLIWGASFLFLKVALTATSPLVLVLLRLLLAAGTLAVIMVATRRSWPRDRVLWGHQAVVSLLLCVVPYLVVAWGAQYVGTGLAGIITAATPMTTVLFTAVLLPSERLGRPGVVGLVLGAVGVVIIVGGDGLGGSIPGLLACLAGPVCFGAGYAYQRRFVSARGLDGVTEASMQMVLALGMTALVAPVLLDSPLAQGGDGPVTLAVVLALAALGIVSTGLGFVGNAVVLQAWGAQRTASITYLMPVVTVTLGVLFLGESLEWLSVAGGVVVVIGVLVGRVPTPTETLEAEVVLEAERILTASCEVLESAEEALVRAELGPDEALGHASAGRVAESGGEGAAPELGDTQDAVEPLASSEPFTA
ncbi:DMT family transporter [Actinotalea sp.]|uniref:DMT family transporter n=1 Tax=Actinotalea sp. TaxID=1872145 RepID=UPI003566D865